MTTISELALFFTAEWPYITQQFNWLSVTQMSKERVEFDFSTIHLSLLWLAKFSFSYKMVGTLVGVQKTSRTSSENLYCLLGSRTSQWGSTFCQRVYHLEKNNEISVQEENDAFPNNGAEESWFVSFWEVLFFSQMTESLVWVFESVFLSGKKIIRNSYFCRLCRPYL